AHAVCDRLNLERFIVVQPSYNLLQRDAERELLPYCHEEKLGVLSYSPLMGGFLTGKYSKDLSPPPESRGKYNPGFWERINVKRNFIALDELSNLANSANVSLRQLAVAWILKNPTITGIILGASTPQQVEENCKLLEIDISAE